MSVSILPGFVGLLKKDLHSDAPGPRHPLDVTVAHRRLKTTEEADVVRVVAFFRRLDDTSVAVRPMDPALRLCRRRRRRLRRLLLGRRRRRRRPTARRSGAGAACGRTWSGSTTSSFRSSRTCVSNNASSAVLPTILFIDFIRGFTSRKPNGGGGEGRFISLPVRVTGRARSGMWRRRRTTFPNSLPRLGAPTYVGAAGHGLWRLLLAASSAVRPSSAQCPRHRLTISIRHWAALAKMSRSRCVLGRVKQ